MTKVVTTTRQFRLGPQQPTKMQESSLRTPRRAPTRKPTIVPPLPAGQPIPRGGPKSRVDDRIKKRMSMRYAEMVASPTGAEPVPPMPGFPGTRGGEGMMSLGASMNMMGDEDVRDPSSRAVQDDKRILEDEKFDPDTCKPLQNRSLHFLDIWLSSFKA